MMKKAIEKEELRGRINKILRDEIGRKLLDRTADKIIDALLGDEPEPQEPREGQICEFWNVPECPQIGMLEKTFPDPLGRRMYSDGRTNWRNAKVCRDPLIRGRLLAPEGAEWIAPWSDDTWAFFVDRPYYVGKDGFYLGDTASTPVGVIQTFPAPTDVCEPIKLWED